MSASDPGTASNLVLIATCAGALIAPFAGNLYAKLRNREESKEQAKTNDKVIGAIVHNPDSLDHIVLIADKLSSALDRLDITLRSETLASRMDATSIVDSNHGVQAAIGRLCEIMERLIRLEGVRMMAPPSDTPDDMAAALSRIR